MLSREKDRLLRVLGGIVDMGRLPGALFIVDVRKERLAVKEAQTLGIPIFAIVDTNVDPTPIDYPIPANDDSLKTIALITKEMTDAIIMGKEASTARMADAAAADESQKDIEGGEIDEDGVKTRRRTRSRRTGGDGTEAASGDAAEEAAAVAAETAAAAPTVVSANESDTATMDTTIGVTGGEENDPGTGGKDAEKGEE